MVAETTDTMYPRIAVKLNCIVKSSTWFSINFSSLLATVFDDIEILSAISEISILGLSMRHLIILKSIQVGCSLTF